jgi:arginine metabolism regulation protein II
MSNDANLSKLPGDARLLLDHYSERIIDVMSMSPGQKAPWKTIHLPCAMEAFAEIIVHGQTRSVAKMALFYALLSISSFHIGSANDACDDRATYWQKKGAEYKQVSESYLRSALRGNMPKAARGKYKEVLMSVLSMVTIGVSYIL